LDAPLARLVELQRLELKTRGLEEEIDSVPAELAAASDRLEAASKQAEAAKRAQERAVKQRREQELELKSLEDRLRRHAEQLMSVKTNEEYRALTNELAHERQRVSEIEDRILSAMEEADRLAAEASSAEAQVRQAESELGTDKGRLEAKRERLGRDRDALVAEAAALAAQLPEPLLGLYRKLAVVRGGVALAAIVDESCSACRLRIRPQVLSQLRSSDSVIQCESCQRILHFESETTGESA